MPSPNSIEVEELRFEIRRLRAELDDLAKDAKEEAEKKKEKPSVFSNPVALAVVGGFITLMTGIATGAYTAYQTRELETLKAEFARKSAQDTFQSDLIKKFVEGPPQTVRENLKFLVDSGLLPTYQEAIKRYLDENPNSAPRIGYMITGKDEAVEMASLPATYKFKAYAASVGRLMQGPETTCTAFLIAPDLIASAAVCDQPVERMKFSLGSFTSDLSLVTLSYKDFKGEAYVIYRLATPAPAQFKPLAISDKAPKVGDTLAIIMFRDGDKALVVEGGNCHVVEVNESAFGNLCDTGSGTAGAPIFNQEGLVVGVSGSGYNDVGWATIASVMLPLLQAK